MNPVIPPLITPGNYNLTYNELYKLVALGVNSLLFLVVIGIGVWFILKYFKGWEVDEKAGENTGVHKKIEIFFTLIRNLEDTEEVMGLSQKMKERYFLSDLRKILNEIQKEEGVIFHQYGSYEIKKYLEYKQLIFGKEEDK